jgi:hypothetical protein
MLQSRSFQFATTCCARFFHVFFKSNFLEFLTPFLGGGSFHVYECDLLMGNLLPPPSIPSRADCRSLPQVVNAWDAVPRLPSCASWVFQVLPAPAVTGIALGLGLKVQLACFLAARQVYIHVYTYTCNACLGLFVP